LLITSHSHAYPHPNKNQKNTGALYLLARGVFAAAAALVDSVPGLVKLLPLLAHST
jgi:hypothetical protein